MLSRASFSRYPKKVPRQAVRTGKSLRATGRASKKMYPMTSQGGIGQLLRPLKFWLQDPKQQIMMVMIAAMVLATCIFTGFLSFKLSDDDALFQHGKQLYREGKTAWAINTFETLITHNPKHYEGYLYLGRAYLEEHNLPKAEQAFRQATLIRESTEVGADLTTAVVSANLAMIHGRYRDAEVALLPLAQKPEYQQNPEFRAIITKLYTTWGDELSQQGSWQRAVLQYEQALHYVRAMKDQKALELRILSCYQSLIAQAQKAHDAASLVKYYAQRLKYQHTLQDLLTLADLERQQRHWSNALSWYRQAYQENPKLWYYPLKKALQHYRTTLGYQEKALSEQLSSELSLLEQAFVKSQPTATTITHVLPAEFQGFEVKNLVLVRPVAPSLALDVLKPSQPKSSELAHYRKLFPYGVELYFTTPPKYPLQTLRLRLKVQRMSYPLHQETLLGQGTPIGSPAFYELPFSEIRCVLHPVRAVTSSSKTPVPYYRWIGYWGLSSTQPSWLGTFTTPHTTATPRSAHALWDTLSHAFTHPYQTLQTWLPFLQDASKTQQVVQIELQSHVWSQHPNDWVPMRKEAFSLGASLGTLEGEPPAI
ncbi:MAG: tetratricopeptide repeat protein [Vampirovibrionales bacterium]